MLRQAMPSVPDTIDANLRDGTVRALDVLILEQGFYTTRGPGLGMARVDYY
jgi:hypothetical protein